MSNTENLTEQLLALSYVEASASNDEYTKEFILEELGSKNLISALTDLVLVLSTTMADYLEEDLPQLALAKDVRESIHIILQVLRESFIDHVQVT